MNLKEGMHIIYDVLIFFGMAIVYSIEAFVLIFIPRRYRNKSVKNEIALITGGADGIGQLIAIKLAKLGAQVVIWDIDKAGLLETAEKIKTIGGICYTYCCNIADKDEVYRTAKAVKIEVGSVTLLINNAGHVCGKTFMELSDHEIERTFQVNILSHYWITKSFLTDMMKNNHGHIVTIGSITGFIGNYSCTDYSATKFATIGYHESLVTELKVQGYDKIHMTLVCPYLINTKMFYGVKFRLMKALEPAYVAEEVVAGILRNEMVIVLPKYLTSISMFKWLFPSKMVWAAIYNVFQIPQAMILFKGREFLKMINGNNNIKKYENVYAR